MEQYDNDFENMRILQELRNSHLQEIAKLSYHYEESVRPWEERLAEVEEAIGTLHVKWLKETPNADFSNMQLDTIETLDL